MTHPLYRISFTRHPSTRADQTVEVDVDETTYRRCLALRDSTHLVCPLTLGDLEAIVAAVCSPGSPYFADPTYWMRSLLAVQMEKQYRLVGDTLGHLAEALHVPVDPDAVQEEVVQMGLRMVTFLHDQRRMEAAQG